MFDQIYPHLGAIFVGWIAALGAVALTAAFTERRWLERICIGVGVVLLAIPLLYLAGLPSGPDAVVSRSDQRWLNAKMRRRPTNMSVAHEAVISDLHHMP
jgi:peptidoglycan/LPS O-acetylase OafA/YrhL